MDGFYIIRSTTVYLTPTKMLYASTDISLPPPCMH
jgi:hypothetical protein